MGIATLQSSRRNRRAKRSRWAHVNSPAGLRNRKAKADARREAIAALLPPIPDDPEPLSLWQTITVQLYVPTSGRCDQHAVMIDDQRVGLLSATALGREVAARALSRPSQALQADQRREAVLLAPRVANKQVQDELDSDTH